ncbi:ABC transporter permease [Pseudoalteromonas sp. C2R02]|uniref:FtsX-like permease family protein n=1 Tax=Pseudoalteromonas sp. C2R02 TaxID=2841565 RepID=UPI001C091DAD|nr:FtsX-like permease family protein [Pseudoalteromonas sp. C2R02]MBU2972190.1 ABC transporter permease [Pseudoalteromonas sp. C2R02]
MFSWLDIKYAVRLLHKRPIFTVTSVLIAAIGLGLTLYTYSLLSQLIFKPLTLDNDTPLIAIEGEFKESYAQGRPADPYHLNQISTQTELLQGMSLYTTGIRTINGLDNKLGTKKLNASLTQWNLFEVAGIQPILGRGFSPRDQFTGAESVAVIGYDVWQNMLSGNRDIIGTSIVVDGVVTQIIGVMPQGFALPATAQIWQPLAEKNLTPTKPSKYDSFWAVGRLKKGVSLTQFQQEMQVILQKHYQDLPQEFSWRASSPGGYIKAFHFKLTHDAIFQHYSVFIAMMLMVILILILTCINIGNLLLARVNEQIKDVAIRIALGIQKKRLVLQMLWESIFICCLGGLIAILIAGYGLEVTNNVLEQIFAINGEKPFWWQLSLSADAIIVLLVTIALMIFLTGFIPAWRALSGDFNAVLKDGTRGATGKKSGKINKLLVVCEIGLSCVVLVIATILLSTSYSAKNADYGIETQNRITATLLLPTASYPWNRGAPESKKKRYDFYYQLKDQLTQLPNVNSVGYFSAFPGTGGGTSHYETEGKPAEVFDENPVWNFEGVGLDSWHSVGMSIIKGRDFDFRDIDSKEESIIINESMAKDHFPNGDAIGQRIRSVRRGGKYSSWRTIIGIVSDSVHGSVMEKTSAKHTGYGVMNRWNTITHIAVHYTGSQSQATTSLLKEINNIDSDVAAYHIQSYDNLIAQPMMLVNAVNKIFLWCGLVALFLATTGIYAVTANSITLRSQEIATRRALGARDKQVFKLFMNQAAKQLCLGLTLGISLSLWIITQLTQSMIINHSSYFIGLVAMPIIIIIMVFIATYIPTRKIILMEPSEALHQR